MNMEALETREEQEAFVQDALERAEVLRKKKEYKEGISLLVEALRYGIDKATIYYKLGNIYIDGDDFNRAEYAYKRALDIDSHHSNAMHNLSIVYKRQKKITLYVKTYKKSQRMELRHPPGPRDRSASLQRDAQPIYRLQATEEDHTLCKDLQEVAAHGASTPP
jgi:tetratricopeptide (TPR) repeat protein